MKCKDIIFSLNDLMDTKVDAEHIIIPKFNESLPNRTADCELGVVGKPVFYHAIESEQIGAWMRDVIKVENATVEKVWITKESDKNHLFEYQTKTEYQSATKVGGSKIKTKKPIQLPCEYEVKICFCYA